MYKKIKISHIVLVLAFLAFVLSLSGCSLLLNSDFAIKSNEIISRDKNAEARDAGKTELHKNRLLWEKNKVENYDFVCEIIGGGLYPWVPVLIKVRNGKVVSTKPARKKLELERIDKYEQFETVEKIFDQIQQSYDKNYVVKVEYDKDLGYPAITHIDNLEGIHPLIVKVNKFEVIKTESK